MEWGHGHLQVAVPFSVKTRILTGTARLPCSTFTVMATESPLTFALYTTGSNPITNTERETTCYSSPSLSNTPCITVIIFDGHIGLMWIESDQTFKPSGRLQCQRCSKVHICVLDHTIILDGHNDGKLSDSVVEDKKLCSGIIVCSSCKKSMISI